MLLPTGLGLGFGLGGVGAPAVALLVTESIHAANAIFKALDAQTVASLVIFMISGGGSSIVEKAIDGEILLDDLSATYRALVLSGAPIAEINAIRKHLSAVKGGRLARAASSCKPDTTGG